MTELSAGNHRQPASRPQRGFDAGSYVARRRLKHRSRSQRRARPTPALERAGPGPRVGRTRPQARPDEVGSAPLAALRNRAVPTRTKGVPPCTPVGRAGGSRCAARGDTACRLRAGAAGSPNKVAAVHIRHSVRHGRHGNGGLAFRCPRENLTSIMRHSISTCGV